MTLQGDQSRIALIARILLWEGRVGRSRIASEFGLSDVRASQWLREMREAYPRWTRWDSRQRKHIATPSLYADVAKMSRGLLTPFLRMVLTPSSSGDPGAPVYSVVPRYIQAPNPLIFAQLHMAISDARQVQFTYASMGHPEPHIRTLEPHSLVLAGRRWHARGYCVEKGDFRDFVLGRMHETKVLDADRTADPGDDVAWNTIVPVSFVAHPQLTLEQQQVVRDEFFWGTAARMENCRGALVAYLIQELRASIDQERERPPDFQLFVENIKECKRWLFPS